jgi:hypothetical protein
MRRLTVLLFSAIAFQAAAQTKAPKLEPLPDVPPPPPGIIADDAEPQITIVKRGKDRVEEYRMKGKLYMLKVTPPDSEPYYLMDTTGDGNMVRQGSPTASGLRVPMWVIKSF